MKIIVGLGNPGINYEKTRHNLGFWVIEKLIKKLEIELNEEKFNGLYYKSSDYIILKPQTFVNNSGECILAFINHFQISLDNLLVIYDDINIPLGSFRYRLRGSSGGHNGVKNIIEKLKSSDFKRLRFGIGFQKEHYLVEWVLGEFTNLEKKKIEKETLFLLNSLVEWIKGKEWEKIVSNYKK